jgi:hypothetical protein
MREPKLIKTSIPDCPLVASLEAKIKELRKQEFHLLEEIGQWVRATRRGHSAPKFERALNLSRNTYHVAERPQDRRNKKFSPERSLDILRATIEKCQAFDSEE